MFWYILALALSMLFASAAQKLKGKTDLEVDGGIFYFRSSYYCMMVLSFLPLFIVAAIRYEVGTDWPIYFDYYNWINIRYKDFSEKLFNLMNEFVYWLVNDFQGVIVLVAFLSYFFLFKAIYEQSVSFPLSVLVFFVSTMYFASMNQLRQAIAMPIMLYAYKYIRDKKPLSYLFWCVIASFIHASSLVYAPLYLIVRWKPSIRQYVTVFVLCVVSLPVLHLLMEVIIGVSQYAWYSTSVYNTGSEANNFYLLGFLFQLVLFVIMAYYRFASEKEDPIYDGMLNCYFLSVISLLFTPVLSQILRISQCFGYCQILLVPRMIDREKDRTRRIVLYILVIGLYTAKMLYDVYHLGWNGVIPYQTIFTK